MTTNMNETQPLACDLTAIPIDRRTGHIDTILQLFQATEETQALPDGYAFRLPNNPGMWIAAAHIIDNERQCCPFFRFTLEMEPHSGPIWLRLTGADGVKALLETMLGDQIDTPALTQLIHTDGDDALDQAVAQAIPQFAGIIAVGEQAS